MDAPAERPPGPPRGGFLHVIGLLLLLVPPLRIHGAGQQYREIEEEMPEMTGGAWFLSVAALQALMLAFDIAATVLFFQRRRLAPVALQAYIGTSVVCVLAAQLLDVAYLEAEFDPAVIRNVTVFALVWIAYFQLSRRVKSTFVR